MTMAYGKRNKRTTPSPSSSGAIKLAVAACPHANLLPPPDPMIAETARRAEVSNEARGHFYAGLLGHEILARYPEENHWMAEKMGEWEVVFRREQIQFIENLDKPTPKPKFTPAPPAPKAAKSEYLPLPPIDVDKPKLKSVGITATIVRSDTGEVVEEMVWWPRKMIKGGKVSSWIVGEKRKELEAKFPIASIENFPE